MAGTKVKFETSAGDFIIELEDEKAPVSAENFRKYVESGFYDGTVFHRIISGFVVQGGGFMPEFKSPEVEPMEPIQNEADNGLKNTKYSLSMARTSDPQSATSQFFINLDDNVPLDHTDKTQQGWGYAVFGRVTQGQEVIDALGKVATGRKGPFQDVPKDDVSVIKASVL